jgi:hypothetical protein
MRIRASVQGSCQCERLQVLDRMTVAAGGGGETMSGRRSSGAEHVGHVHQLQCVQLGVGLASCGHALNTSTRSMPHVLRDTTKLVTCDKESFNLLSDQS